MYPIVLLLWRTLTHTNPSLRNVGTYPLILYSIMTWILTSATLPLTSCLLRLGIIITEDPKHRVKADESSLVLHLIGVEGTVNSQLLEAPQST